VCDYFVRTSDFLIYNFRHLVDENVDKPEEHHEDIENFVQLLTDLGVSVKRPKLPEKVYKIKTPYWESVVHPALNVRDQCIVIGNTIIETPPTCRWRYFENDYLKH
jgi:glycine amidinotransferase